MNSVSHTTSRTWVSPQTKEFENWAKIRESLMRTSPHSPFTPQTFAEWVAHRVAIKEDQVQRATRRIDGITGTEDAGKSSVQPVFGGATFPDRLGLVLAQETIWRSPNLGRPWAQWPSYEEFKHEGDDRSRSGYSRFLPLPRDPSNETVNWKQRKLLAPFAFDHPERQTIGRVKETIGMAENQFLVELVGASLFLMISA